VAAAAVRGGGGEPPCARIHDDVPASGAALGEQAQEYQDPRAVDEDEERQLLLLSDKEKLLRHLRDDIYVTLRPSERHGVGVVPFRDIPAGVDPFKTNTTLRTIDLTRDEVRTLPDPVQDIVHRFIVPHGPGRNLYPIPEAGLNALDLSYYVNSSKSVSSGRAESGGGAAARGSVEEEMEEECNMGLGSKADKRGYTELLTSRDVAAGEELLWPYTFTGRGKGYLDPEGRHAADPLPEEVINNIECKICCSQLEDGEDIVDTRCEHVCCVCEVHNFLLLFM